MDPTLEHALYSDPRMAITAMARCYADNPVPLFALDIERLAVECGTTTADLLYLMPSIGTWLEILAVQQTPPRLLEPVRLRLV